MPKLTKTHAGKAAQAAGDWNDSGFEPLQPGWYLCRLLDVEQREGKQAPYWSWKYEEVSSKHWVWDNTSLSERAIGRLGKVFEAYGVPSDTDTDDLIGQLVNLELGVYTIPSGNRAGQLSNNIRSVAPGDTHPDIDDYAETKPAVSDFKPNSARGRKADPADEPF